jgi:AraC family transcriptional regulator, regulatory protein of adaptative response / DNA-3-methyladenine glycosylase II
MLHVLSLSHHTPYDWETLLSWLRTRAIPSVELVAERHYARTFELDGQHGTLHVEQGSAGSLRASVSFPSADALPLVRARLERLFDLGAQPTAIGEQLSKDAALARLVAARPGLRVPGAWDGFELAVRAVLGQQITVGAAATLAHKLVRRHGAALVGGEPSAGLTHLFPRPDQLAHADLTDLGMPRARAATLTALARAVADDPMLLTRHESLDHAIARLCAVRGIGPWTAQYIAMRELRYADAFPLGDVVIARVVAALERRTFTPKQLALHSERWRPYRSYAAQHLWAFAAEANDAARKRGGDSASKA